MRCISKHAPSERRRPDLLLGARTWLERRLADLHEEKLAKLNGFRHGIDPTLIREAIDRLSEEENRWREELTQITRKPDEQVELGSVSRLREGGRAQRGPCSAARKNSVGAC